MAQAVGARSRIWSGLILVFLGVLFLLDRFGYIRFGEVVERWWPSALVAVGVIQLVKSRGRRWGGPVLLICVGLLFQGERLHLFIWWRARELWPLLLIAVGVGLLVGRLRTKSVAPAPGAMSEDAEVVDAFVVLGGLERAVTSQQFRGGDATAIMGGIDLDLRRAELASGEQRLYLTAMMGGVTIRVPENWQVAVEGTPLMGGIEDKRSPAAAAPAGAGAPAGAVPSAAGRLRVHGFALMGGIAVKT